MIRPFVAATSILVGLSCGAEPGVRTRADCLLVVVDTLRADALSCYGNTRETSPNLDRFAEVAARFDECLAQAPNTATSHATLFTGLHPWAHRAANLTSLEDGTPGLPPAFETLAERFEAAGYQTAAFTDGGPLGRSWNLCQGFGVLEARYEGVRAKVDGALRFLDEGRDGRPLLLFVHTYQTHLPYAPPKEWVERFVPDLDGPLAAAVAAIRASRARGELQTDGRLMLRDRERFTARDMRHLRALYDAEVAYTDHELARLLDAVGPDWVVAVTSDHGEEFGEHGELGHVQLHRETLRVPLLLRLPDGLGAGETISVPVGLIGLHETLLEACGLAPSGTGSRSLLGLLRGEREPMRTLFAETTEHLYAKRKLAWRRSVRFSGRALLAERADPGEPATEVLTLYELGSDPAEARNLLATAAGSGSSRFVEEGRSLLQEHLADQVELRIAVVGNRPLVHVIEPGEDTARELRALGYLELDEDED